MVVVGGGGWCWWLVLVVGVGGGVGAGVIVWCLHGVYITMHGYGYMGMDIGGRGGYTRR